MGGNFWTSKLAPRKSLNATTEASNSGKNKVASADNCVKITDSAKPKSGSLEATPKRHNKMTISKDKCSKKRTGVSKTRDESLSNKRKKEIKQTSNKVNGKIIFSDSNVVYWQVDVVLDRRVIGGKEEYLVRWEGCSDDQNS